MGRRLKTKLPATAQQLKPPLYNNVYDKLKSRQVKQKYYFDRSAKHLPTLKEGEAVRFRVRNTWQPAFVKHSHVQPRSFVIKTPEGSTFRRNRQHLLKSKEDSFPEQDSLFQGQEDLPATTGDPVDTRVMPTPVPSPVKETVTLKVTLAGPVRTSRFGRLKQLKPQNCNVLVKGVKVKEDAHYKCLDTLA